MIRMIKLFFKKQSHKNDKNRQISTGEFCLFLIKVLEN